MFRESEKVLKEESFFGSPKVEAKSDDISYI
jgi:hypothetical protein